MPVPIDSVGSSAGNGITLGLGAIKPKATPNREYIFPVLKAIVPLGNYFPSIISTSLVVNPRRKGIYFFAIFQFFSGGIFM